MAAKLRQLESWVEAILAHPVSKLPIESSDLPEKHGVLDARVFLKHTYGFSAWVEGQDEYERDAELAYESQSSSSDSVANYLAEIGYDQPVYRHYQLNGRVLDCGGGAGTLRQFLPSDVEFVSIDPWLHAASASSDARKQAYTCLTQPLNFIAGTAEFLPFVACSFDWVHMRSMLDHVQVADLAMLEARRVLRPDGRLLIGLYVEGGRTGVISPVQRFKELIKHGLEWFGVDRWKDHHVWHPTYSGLIKLIEDNGFEVEDTYWQPQWNDTVCYVCARKAD